MVTRTQALTIAKDLVKKRIHGLAVEANLHVLYGLNSPGARNAAQERDRLREALIMLGKIMLEDK